MSVVTPVVSRLSDARAVAPVQQLARSLQTLELEAPPRLKVAFLDRDGVINVDHGYVSRWSDFTFESGALDGMRALLQLGFEIVVITNQSGIGRGYYTEADFHALTAAMLSALKDELIEVAGVYFCPHHPSAAQGEFKLDCACRKPAPGMIFEACEQLSIDRSVSIFIGDKTSDMEAAQAAGIERSFRYGAASGLDWPSIIKQLEA